MLSNSFLFGLVLITTISLSFSTIADRSILDKQLQHEEKQEYLCDSMPQNCRSDGKIFGDLRWGPSSKDSPQVHRENDRYQEDAEGFPVPLED